MTLKEHSFSRAGQGDQIDGALQAAEKLCFRVGRGFIPGVNAMKSMGPSGPEVNFRAIPHKFPGFSAASLAPEGTFSAIRTFTTGC